jgi:uncharacterized protein (TIGR01777 family)
MRAIVTGATGFIGQHLLARLDRPIVLSRNARQARQSLERFNVAAFDWDPATGPPPAEVFDGVDAVFHLAGDPIAEGRWTSEKKRRIRESRVVGTRNLFEGLAKLTTRPRVLVSASAVGLYGSRGDEVLDEMAPPGGDFLAGVCQAWEKESQAATELGIRVVNIRTGVALGREGGALKKMLLPFQLGLGGPLGDGRHWMSWIHVDDLAELFVAAAENEELRGPVNGVAPNPVTNRDFTNALAATLHRPALFRAPHAVLRLLLGEVADVLFSSQRAMPKAALDAGFQFRHPALQPALAAILES